MTFSPYLFDIVFQDRYRHFKTAPEDSLTYKLAVLLCVVNHSHGGLKAVAHVWQEFALEMRYRLENNYTIPWYVRITE